MKTCKSCKEKCDFGEFKKGEDIIFPSCKKCRKAYVFKDFPKWKECEFCKEKLEIAEFVYDGFEHICCGKCGKCRYEYMNRQNEKFKIVFE